MTAKAITVKFPYAYSLRDFEVAIDTLGAGARAVPRTMITSTISLDAVPGAIEALRTSQEECKVMIDSWLE